MTTENKTINLRELYNQIQEMMNTAGIPDATLTVTTTMKLYEFDKAGKYGGVKKTEPDLTISVYISKEGTSSITAEHWSLKVVMALIEAALEKRKMESAATEKDRIINVTV